MRITVFIAICFLACSSPAVPKGILPPEKMKPLLFDMIRVDEFANNYIATDTSKKINIERIKLYEKVFALHKTTSDDFFKSYQYYQQNPDVYKVLFDSLLIYGNRVKEEQQGVKKLPEINTNKR